MDHCGSLCPYWPGQSSDIDRANQATTSACNSAVNGLQTAAHQPQRLTDRNGSPTPTVINLGNARSVTAKAAEQGVDDVGVHVEQPGYLFNHDFMHQLAHLPRRVAQVLHRMPVNGDDGRFCR